MPGEYGCPSTYSYCMRERAALILAEYLAVIEAWTANAWTDCAIKPNYQPEGE